MNQIGTRTLLAGLLCLAATGAYAQGDYPIMDRIAQRVVEKYQTSSCQQLAAQRGQRPTGRRGEIEARVVRMLHQDPQMRQAFLNKVAAPIANRLFECGIIP
jgi:ABC-type Fe2+-enterobactin transport system substrate-binding protein